MTAPEALRQIATAFDTQADELQEDWANVLVRAVTRARIDTFREAAKMCRAAAEKLNSHRHAQKSARGRAKMEKDCRHSGSR